MAMWESKAFWLKGKVYMDKANSLGPSENDFALWSALSLELLARAALTKVHPALNADPREETSLLYAFGYKMSEQPRSIPAHSVYLRLEKIIVGFGKPQRELCDYMALMRNQEIHTGELPFSGLSTKKWLPRFYDVSKILCKFIGKSLGDYLGKEVAKSAERLISALNKSIESTVKQKIADHAKAFRAKTPRERKKLFDMAETRTSFLMPGLKRERCPSCKSFGILKGELIKELAPEYLDGRLLMDQQFLGTEFECIACDLELSSVEEIYFSDIESQFTQTRETDLHELFQAEFEPEYENM